VNTIGVVVLSILIGLNIALVIIGAVSIWDRRPWTIELDICPIRGDMFSSCGLGVEVTHFINNIDIYVVLLFFSFSIEISAPRQRR
jgi:hypothetical protein